MTSVAITQSPAMRIATIVVSLAAIRCGSNSPANPSSAIVVSNVTFGATSVAAGSTASGTISLSAPAPSGGVTVTMASSNPAVASVQTPVTVAAGASSTAISVTAVSVGTATISASLNGTTRQSSMLTVTARPGVILSSISLSASSVVAGDVVRGTVTLSDVAPAVGVVVALSAGDPVSVPASVTVPAGFASATFPVMTRAGSAAASIDIQASYAGVSVVATLAVTAPTVATARFGVTGPSGTETCTLANNGSTLNCMFNGTTSTAPGHITSWDWSYGLSNTFSQTTSGPVLTMPAVNCQLMPPPPLPAGTQWFTMVVTLIVHDDLGNVSAKAVDDGVRLIPTGNCGF